MEEGANVPPFYDSMIAKLIVHAPDRPAAVERLRAALESFVVDGVSTNILFLQGIAQHPDFISNRVDTRWLESVFLPQYGQPKEA
jgi:acetyl-CoA carboxylase biotin carboxylase subunit